MSYVINILKKISFNEYCPENHIFEKYVQIMTENMFSNIIHQIINDIKIRYLIFDFHVPTCVESP